jgi:hypothetical protein
LRPEDESRDDESRDDERFVHESMTGTISQPIGSTGRDVGTE